MNSYISQYYNGPSSGESGMELFCMNGSLCAAPGPATPSPLHLRAGATQSCFRDHSRLQSRSWGGHGLSLRVLEWGVL